MRDNIGTDQVPITTKRVETWWPFGAVENPRVRRWFLLPPGRFDFNVWLHRIHGSDVRGVVHDHPWPTISIVLWRPYREIFQDGSSRLVRWFAVRPPAMRHRIELLDESKPSWTLFITGRRTHAWRQYREDVP